MTYKEFNEILNRFNIVGIIQTITTEMIEERNSYMGNTFVSKFDKELLEIGYILIDDYLIQKSQEYDYKITLINEDNVKRTFKVNAIEKYIEGVGIKGFFKKYKEPYLHVDEVAQNEYALTSPSSTLPALTSDKGGGDFRVQQIISQMKSFHEMDDSWFMLYEYAKGFINTTADDTMHCVASLTEIQKYEYQIKTVHKVFNQFRGRVLLCDEVGLGKTIEACMAMTEYIMRGLVKKVLILTPASLVDQWYNETKNLFNLDFIRADDPLFKKEKEQSWSKHNKVIASIASAKRKPNSDAILAQQYDLVIIDEAHHLKNTKSVAWQFVNNLNKKYIFLLTATPVQNSLEELYNLITLLKPGQLRTYNYFKRNFIGDKDGLVVKNPRRLKELLNSVMIRNRRSDVDVTFTKRFATTYHLNLSLNERNLYIVLSEFIKAHYKDTQSVLSHFVLKNLQEKMGSSFQTLLTSLVVLEKNEKLPSAIRDQIAGIIRQVEAIIEENPYNAKLQQIHEIATDFEGKILIFTKFRKTQEIIVDFLKGNNYKIAQFNGSMPKREKERQVQYFREEAKILVSTESGGEGRNLQFCNCLINYDLPWNPMAIEQRIGRIHRIGQEKDVYVYNLCAKETIEYYILELLDKKINMFELAIGEVDMILGDIEEKEDFADRIMEIWVQSTDKDILEREIEVMGKILIESKQRFHQIKTIDEKIFAELSE